MSRLLFALTAATLAAAPASAAVTFYHSRAAWEAAVSNPTTVTDFEDMAYGTLGETHSWGNVTLATSDPGSAQDLDVVNGATTPSGHHLNNTHILQAGLTTVTIAGGTYAFALDMQSLFDSLSLLFIGDYNSSTVGFDDGDGFIGFVSDSLVDTLSIYPLGGPVLLDNLTLGSLPNQGGAQPANVPEPAMLGLFGLGALGLGLSRRRRRAA